MGFKENFEALPVSRGLEYYIGTTNSFTIHDLPKAIVHSGPIFKDADDWTDDDYDWAERYEKLWKDLEAPSMVQWGFQKQPNDFDGYVYDVGNRYAVPNMRKVSVLNISKKVYISGNGGASASSSTADDLWDVKLTVVTYKRTGEPERKILINHPYSQKRLSSWELVEWLHNDGQAILHELLSVAH